MERRWQLDVAGRTSIRGRVIRTLALVLFLFAVAPPGTSQTTFPSSEAISPTKSTDNLSARLRQLYADQRWKEIVGEVKSPSAADPDLDYYYGSALAQLGRLDDARQAFLAGRRASPGDQRFPIELAGVDFKQKHYSGATSWLRRALRLDPADAYANEFLGTVYLLQGNLEAALKYWNRIGKPQVQAVRPDHPVRIKPALLDRALALSPASELRLADLETSRVRIEGLQVFPQPRFQLAAEPNNKFDVVLNLQERNGWGGNGWVALLSIFSGVGYRTIYPEYSNIGGAATNVTSLLRWDGQKRRLEAALSGPLHENPKWRYRLALDLRNENWDIRNSFTGVAPVLGALNLRREAASADIDSFHSGRWGWSAGVEFSHRDYRQVMPGSTLTSELLLTGPQLKQLAGIHYALLRVPEHRFALDTAASSQLARIWAQPAQAFAKLQGSLQAHWFPQAEGDDYEARSQIRAGATTGRPPFDELSMLGMERDNDLWMRAHIGTRDGRKGSAPLGRRYWLSNSEIDKNVYSNGLITAQLGPFLDTGKITDPSGHLGSRKWLWDTGAQAKLRVLGVGVTLVYGKDLRTGNNAFYFTAGR
jgi:tetratricopeptide (TPR) repeat protein